MVRVAVVGAGMVGLCTAVNVQKAMPEARVTLMADKFHTHTTSAGAGGIFEPTEQGIPGVPVDTIRRWSRESWEFFTGLAQSSQAEETGSSLVEGYMLSNNQQQVENPLYADIVFNFRVLRADELKRLKFSTKYGNTFTTVITQPKKIMPWLMKRFKGQGGIVEVRRLKNLGELAGDYDIVMNCTGMEARWLVNDTAVYPIKGQMVCMKAPWMKTFIYHCDMKRPVYLIPHDDVVWVGGTRDEGEYSDHLCPDVEDDILQRAFNFMPQLQTGEVVGRWAGLRPQRRGLRLEKETITANGKTLRVVHNYGHGANGITLSWGTSLEAAQMAREWASQLPSKAKL